MKLLVATTEGQGMFEDDYFWALDGELVYVQATDCSRRDCGGDRGFAGMASSQATTTAKVVDRPEFAPADLEAALTDSLVRGGWLDKGGGGSDHFVAGLLSMLHDSRTVRG